MSLPVIFMRSLLCLLLAGSAASAQELAHGRITDKETGKPVPFASIGVVGTSRGTTSNTEGEFSLLLNEPFTVRITCVGYESVTISSMRELATVVLIPEVRQLSEIYISTKQVNARRVVQKAFASVADNYPAAGYLQKFFYRHYCKDDSVYGRLIEASVEVWKHQGYKSMRRTSGDREEIRVTQLRRSLDNTAIAQSHTPISVGNVLQADLAGYQTAEKSEHIRFFAEAGNLKTDPELYQFSFDGYTMYDGQEVYMIAYASKKDSILTTGGYVPTPSVSGTLFITTREHAFIRLAETKREARNTIRTTAVYRNINGKYYANHLVRDGENKAPDGTSHQFHIDLMSVDILTGDQYRFTGREPNRQELLAIPYDSLYWSKQDVLKATPLEEEIISHLGVGISLNRQFYLYQQYEAHTTDGGNRGEEKLTWLLDFLKNRKLVYLVFWDAECKSCLAPIERVKQLHKQYRDDVQFVFVSLDQDESAWKNYVARYNLFSDGIINYRIGRNSTIVKSLSVKNTPDFKLIDRSGNLLHGEVRQPNDPLLEDDFRLLMQSKNIR